MVDRVMVRPGGRSQRIRASVHAAGLELLAEQGFGALSLDAVAARAGVHRSTLYRRWGSPAALVLDALRSRSDELVHVPDEGSLAADLRALLVAVRANLTSPLGAAVTVATVADRSDELVDGARTFWDDRLARMSVIVERAVARGEIEPVEPTTVIELAVAPLFFRLLVDHREIDDDYLELVADSLAAGLGTRSHPGG